MKSKAKTPANTIKKICHPWSVAMMKNNAWLGESRLSIGPSHNETAMQDERSCATIMAPTKCRNTWHAKLQSAPAIAEEIRE
jgi:hypothetical protein